MSLGISPTYEKGRCSICKKTKEVRMLTDQDKKNFVKICEECAGKSKLTVSEIVEKYGITCKSD